MPLLKALEIRDSWADSIHYACSLCTEGNRGKLGKAGEVSGQSYTWELGKSSGGRRKKRFFWSGAAVSREM